MPQPVLFTFRRCPYAIRARLTLLQAAIDYDKYEVDLKHKPASLLAISPKATVPVLWISDTVILQESLDIMRWALNEHDPLRWLAELTDEDEHLIQQNDTTFKHSLDRYKYPTRYAPDLVDHQAVCRTFLMDIEDRLSQKATQFETASRAHLGQHQWGFVDVALAPFVRQFAHVNRPWFDQQPWPHLQMWLTAFEQSDAFLQVMQRAIKLA